LRHIDFLDEQLERLTGMIEEQIRRFDPAVELPCTITGIQHRGAEAIVAEIGVDMTRFRSARHLASSAGQCPGNDKSAGKRRSGKTRNGSKWLDYALEEAAIAAIRGGRHYLEAQYRRLKPRRGHKRARGAVKHSILGAIWHVLSTGETYRDLGGDHFTNRDPERQNRRLVKQLESLGHHVTREAGRRSLSELSYQAKQQRLGSVRATHAGVAEPREGGAATVDRSRRGWSRLRRRLNSGPRRRRVSLLMRQSCARTRVWRVSDDP
jgi:hypothetical protein